MPRTRWVLVLLLLLLGDRETAVRKLETHRTDPVGSGRCDEGSVCLGSAAVLASC